MTLHRQRAIKKYQARVRATQAKKKAEKAASFSGLFKETIRGLPVAEKKIARKILAPFRRAWGQNLKEYRRRFRPATSKQIKTTRKYKKK